MSADNQLSPAKCLLTTSCIFPNTTVYPIQQYQAFNDILSGDKNISILQDECIYNFHSSCKHMHLSFKSVCNKEHKGVIWLTQVIFHKALVYGTSALGRITRPFNIYSSFCVTVLKMSPGLGRFPRKHALVHSSIGKIQLVVSRLFAGDNRLSSRFFASGQPVVTRPKSLVTTGCQQTLPFFCCFFKPTRASKVNQRSRLISKEK